MSNSNLPPGVTDSMIPGNRPEDTAWEKLHEQVDADCEAAGLDPELATEIWNAGFGKQKLRKVVQIATDPNPGYNGTIIALCSDGTMWVTTNGYGSWKQMPTPQ